MDLYQPLGDIAARADDQTWQSYFCAGEIKPRAPKRIAVWGGTAIIPLQSIIMRGMSKYGTDPDQFRRAINVAADSEKIKSILVWVDSPGGEIRGIELAAMAVYEANQKKPVVAITADLNASAALWISSNAGKLYSTRDGYTGSHGVVWSHIDVSKAYEDYGVKFTFIHAGKHKVEGNSVQPLSADTKKYVQSRVDGHFAEFTEALARGRDRSTEHVLEHFGQGRVLTAKQAAAAGMIDGIVEADQILGQLQKMTGGVMALDPDATSEFVAALETDSKPESASPQPSRLSLYERKLSLRGRLLNN